MWLINASTLALEFFLPEQAPPYAILSHTWGDGEVSLAEFQQLRHRTKAKPGFSKIKRICDLARAQAVAHVWVDTCCIDKTSSAELSESINSMYSYYGRARVCFAYINDWDPNTSWEDLDASESPPCRWFTRGWTLQELIAPSNVRFYDSTWTFRGTKADDGVLPHLSSITGINKDILRDGSEGRLRGICLAQRMSWASRRETTRKEDIAYCLLGIFQINMPLLYGEGDRAFKRLQEEIIKSTTDLSILAWMTPPGERESQEILSSHPRQFYLHGQSTTRTTMFSPPAAEMAMTNKGLRIEGRIHREVVRKSLAGAATQVSNSVDLDTGCVSTEKDGNYLVYLVALMPEKGGYTNTYKRLYTFGALVGPAGSRSCETIRADLQSIYVVRPEPYFLNNNTSVPEKFLISYKHDSGEKYNIKFKDAWPPSTANPEMGGSYYVPGVVEVAVSLDHSHLATMGYLVFELFTNPPTNPLVEFLVVYHHIGTEREKAEMYTQLAMGKIADDLRRQAAEIEKLEPWPAEDALREYLENGESSGRFLDHLVFTHGDVDVHWRLQSVSPEESRNRYMCRIQTTCTSSDLPDLDWERGKIEREVITHGAGV